MENFHKKSTKIIRISYIFFKIIKLMFTDINIYLINNETDHISEKYNFYRKKSDFRSDWEQDPDPDPDLLLNEQDPRIRIHIIMKRIRNTFFSIVSSSL